MRAYIVGLVATIAIIILNLISGNAAVGFSPLHSWALAIIALVACGVGVYNEWFRQHILNMVKEAGLFDEFESGAEDIATRIAIKMEEDQDNDKK